MPIEVTMPALSPTMTEGTLAKWHVKEGDQVGSGDIIAEIETDKATMEVESIDEGTVGRLLVEEGSAGVKVNTVIALLLEEGEDESSLDAVAVSAPKDDGADESPPAETTAEAAVAVPAEPAPAQSAAPAAKPATTAGNGKDRIFVSPLARRMAAQAGLDLAGLAGSGPHGRIVKADIEAALAKGPPRPEPAVARAAPDVEPALARPAAPVEVPGMPKFTEIPHSTMRKVIARRLVEAKREAPHFYLTIDCEIDELLKVRADLNGRAPQEGPDAYKLSVNDFVIRAVALAMGKVPAANAAWTDDAIRQYDAVDVSVAVAIPNGLITPVIRRSDSKGLATISREMRDLAGRARAGKLLPEEYQGGTVSVSNLGMYGIREFAAVVNPPQGCILAVGAGDKRPVVKDGALAIASVMTCTLSVDHRVVDGAVGAEFLAAYKKLIEDPLTMLL